jgi:hypothetical protein
MDKTLLFLHVLAAFMLASAVVILSASVLGAEIGSSAEGVANRIWDIGGAGTIVFGLWLVFREDEYDVTDAWIIGAIVLWVAGAALAGMIRKRVRLGREGAAAGAPEVTTAPASAGAHPWPAPAVRLHWVHAAVTVGILVLMVWKPGH